MGMCKSFPVDHAEKSPVICFCIEIHSIIQKQITGDFHICRRYNFYLPGAFLTNISCVITITISITSR